MISPQHKIATNTNTKAIIIVHVQSKLVQKLSHWLMKKHHVTSTTNKRMSVRVRVRLNLIPMENRLCNRKIEKPQGRIEGGKSAPEPFKYRVVI